MSRFVIEESAAWPSRYNITVTLGCSDYDRIEKIKGLLRQKRSEKRMQCEPSFSLKEVFDFLIATKQMY